MSSGSLEDTLFVLREGETSSHLRGDVNDGICVHRIRLKHGRKAAFLQLFVFLQLQLLKARFK